MSLEKIRYYIIPELYKYLENLDPTEIDTSELEAAIEDLEEAIGDNSSGIIKEIADLDARVTALEGGDDPVDG